MGRLIDKDRRRRAKEAKKERMQRIREEGLRSFVNLPYVEVTLDAIGRRAGVKKGVASMYFGTREELFLLLVRDELEGWYGELEQRIAAQRARMSDATLARLVAGTLAQRSALTRLLSLAPVVLEQNMEIMEADRFHRWQRDRMASVGEALERRSKVLSSGQGLRLLYLVQLMAAAFHPIAEPKGSLAFNLHDPDFVDLRIDLEQELESFVRGMLGGEGVRE
jgi:AcrR family transcriptional regulator